VRCTLHEISLHHDYNPDEFRPPYLMRPRPVQRSDVLLSPAYTTSLLACMESAHGILEAFIQMDLEIHRSLPVIVYTRTFYALVVLTKLAISAQSPDSSIGKMIDYESIRLIEYSYKMVSALGDAVGDESFGVPATFYAIVIKLTAWYQRQCSIRRSNQSTDETLEPMAYMKMSDGSVQLESHAASSVSTSSDIPTQHLPAQTARSRSTNTPNNCPPATSWPDTVQQFNGPQADQYNYGPNMDLVLPSAEMTWDSAETWNFGIPNGLDIGSLPANHFLDNNGLLAFAGDEGADSDTYYSMT
jgi:hypothetical protein